MTTNSARRTVLWAAALPGEFERAAVRFATAAPLLGRGARVAVATDLSGEHAGIGADALRAAVRRRPRTGGGRWSGRSRT